MNNAKYADYLSEQPRQASTVWRAALYVRLSKEDGDKAESNSVTSQREILAEYLKLNPDIQLYDYYIDDGFSGTNFDRPGFIRMMEDIYSGKVNCVIVKDLSRFCRNYADGGYYMDNVFVRCRVRFIALNNGVDTASNSMNAATQCISVGVTNVINESLAATTSVNVRGTLNVNRRQGKFIGSFPTYGYLKDPDDHHKLIIDEETAPIVRMIFEKFIGGRSIIGITKDLNEMGIPNPSEYKRLRGWNYKHSQGRLNGGLWPDSSVRRILRNEMYIGNMVQGKNTTMSYKIKQCRAIPREDWIIVENTHEAIIDRETFDKAQALIGRNIRSSPESHEVGLFAGLVKCADCLRSMSKKTNVHDYGTYSYYRCTTRRKVKTGGCTNHTIRIDKLYEAVLVTIQKQIDLAVSMSELLDRIERSGSRRKESDHISRSIKTHTAERERCMRMMTDLYPDWKNGIITQEEYMKLKATFSEKLEALDSTIESLNKTAEEYADGLSDENEFISHFKRCGNIDTLTRPMLLELIEEIQVYEGGGIKIVFRFRDAFEKAVRYIEMNGESVRTA